MAHSVRTDKSLLSAANAIMLCVSIEHATNDTNDTNDTLFHSRVCACVRARETSRLRSNGAPSDLSKNYRSQCSKLVSIQCLMLISYISFRFAATLFPVDRPVLPHTHTPFHIHIHIFSIIIIVLSCSAVVNHMLSLSLARARTHTGMGTDRIARVSERGNREIGDKYAPCHWTVHIRLINIILMFEPM